MGEELQKALNVDFSKVDKATIAYGSTGKHYDITGKENLDDFFKIFNGVKLKKCIDQKLYTGFVFSVILYKSDNALCRFNFGSDIFNVMSSGKVTKYNSNKCFSKSQINEIAQKYNLN